MTVDYPPEIDPHGHLVEPDGHRSCLPPALSLVKTAFPERESRNQEKSDVNARLEHLSPAAHRPDRRNCQTQPRQLATIKGYQALSAAGQKPNLLGPKIRELISLAVAVTVRCDGCITVHAEAAARHGASREEIAEALGVATAVNTGTALVYSARVLDAYEQVTAMQAI
jgi:AhpD family alkylhydroperoxidase